MYSLPASSLKPWYGPLFGIMKLSNRYSVLADLPDENRKTIDHLPLELLESIFYLAKMEPESPIVNKDYTGDPNEVNPNEEHPLFKTLRLVCGKWYDIATPALFRTVVLWSHIDSWQKLNDIASTPWLAPHVRTVQLATIRYLDLIENPSDFKLKIALDLWPEEHAGWKYSIPNGGPFAKLATDQESYFARYERWRDGERAMATHWTQQTAPALHLDKLENLARVETVGHDGLAVIKKRYNYTGYTCYPWRTYKNGTRREVETDIQDVVTYGGDICPHHIDLFLTAAHRCGFNLDTLAIRNTQELMKSVHPISLSSLRRLEINLGSHEWDVPYWKRDDFPMSTWFRTLHDLEELSVTWRFRHTNIFSLLVGSTWPRLRYASFSGGVYSCGELVAFIDRHRDSLQELLVEESNMTDDGWTAICRREMVEEWQSKGKRLVLTRPDKGSVTRL